MKSYVFYTFCQMWSMSHISCSSLVTYLSFGGTQSHYKYLALPIQFQMIEHTWHVPIGWASILYTFMICIIASMLNSHKMYGLTCSDALQYCKINNYIVHWNMPHVPVKGIVSDSNNIFLWWKLRDDNEKRLFPKV